MNGKSDWPLDSIGGAYGYYGIVIQRNGIRLGCNGPLIRFKSYAEIYRILGEEQKKLIKKQPKTLEDAYNASKPGYKYLLWLKNKRNDLVNILWRR